MEQKDEFDLAREIGSGNYLKLRELAYRFSVQPGVIYGWIKKGLPL